MQPHSSSYRAVEPDYRDITEHKPEDVYKFKHTRQTHKLIKIHVYMSTNLNSFAVGLFSPLLCSKIKKNV